MGCNKTRPMIFARRTFRQTLRLRLLCRHFRRRRCRTTCTPLLPSPRRRIPACTRPTTPSWSASPPRSRPRPPRVVLLLLAMPSRPCLKHCPPASSLPCSPPVVGSCSHRRPRPAPAPAEEGTAISSSIGTCPPSLRLILMVRRGMLSVWPASPVVALALALAVVLQGASVDGIPPRLHVLLLSVQVWSRTSSRWPPTRTTPTWPPRYVWCLSLHCTALLALCPRVMANGVGFVCLHLFALRTCTSTHQMFIVQCHYCHLYIYIHTHTPIVDIRSSSSRCSFHSTPSAASGFTSASRRPSSPRPPLPLP